MYSDATKRIPPEPPPVRVHGSIFIILADHIAIASIVGIAAMYEYWLHSRHREEGVQCGRVLCAAEARESLDRRLMHSTAKLKV